MKSAIKISLVFGLVVLFTIIMFFIGLYYNLRPEVVFLTILIPVALISIIAFADLEREKYFSQREGGITLFISFLLPIILFASFATYQKDFKEYILSDDLTGETEYETIYVVEPALSLVKAMKSYVGSKLSNDE